MQAWMAAFEGANSGATVNYDPRRLRRRAHPVHRRRRPVRRLGPGDQGRAAAEGQAALRRPARSRSRSTSPRSRSSTTCRACTELNLAPATVAGIFNGPDHHLERPGDRRGQPGRARCPPPAITPVHRVRRVRHHRELHRLPEQGRPRRSGRTRPPTTGRSQGGEAAQGTSGVVGAVSKGDGHDRLRRRQPGRQLGKAKLKVGDEYVGPTAEAAAKVFEESTQRRGRRPGHASPTTLEPRHRRAGTYPVVLVSYLHRLPAVPGRRPGRRWSRRFLTYVISAGRPAGRGAEPPAPRRSPTRCASRSPRPIDAIRRRADRCSTMALARRPGRSS